MTELVDAQFYAPLTSSLTQTNGAGAFSFSRSTTKSIFNASGILESSAINAASINDFGLHIEPASRTNNLLYCRDMRYTLNGVGWTQASGSGVGSEIAPNGTFDTTVTGWSTTAAIAWVVGELELSLSGSLGTAYFIGSLTVGKTYIFTGTFRTAGSGASAAYLSIEFGGNLAKSASNISGINATYTVQFVATATSVYCNLVVFGTASTKCFLDNVSLKEAAVQVALTQTGVDGLANSCSLLTAAAVDATILQTITAASVAACSGFWVKRSVGTGSVFITRDGGSNWTDITSLINDSTFSVVKIENTSVTNPSVGFKIATSGDAIIVDAGLNHAGTTLTLPIFTTSAAVTRAADVLTYQTASNFSDTAGTILATYKPTYDTYAGGSIVGSTTRGLYASTSNSGVQAIDGTNTINGPAGTPSGQIKIGARWSGSSLQCFALDSFGSSGSYDGSFNLSTIGILPGTAGYIRDLAIWTSSLTDNEIRDAWNLITTYITSGSLVGMQSILSSSTSSISTVIYGSITATYVQPTLTATYTVPTIEAQP